MKCNVCGKEFELLKENKYLVKYTSVLWQKAVIYEAFDCPHCGCQSVVNERKDNIAVERSRLSNCKCNAIQKEWKDDDEVVGSHDGIVRVDVEDDSKLECDGDLGDNKSDEQNEELSCEYDYDAMTKEQLINLCKERKIQVVGGKAAKRYFINKLVEFDKFMGGWE